MTGSQRKELGRRQEQVQLLLPPIEATPGNLTPHDNVPGRCGPASLESIHGSFCDAMSYGAIMRREIWVPRRSVNGEMTYSALLPIQSCVHT